MSTTTITKAQRIADLNIAHDPAELSHYFLNTEWHFFNGGRPVALCGHRLNRRPDTRDVTSTSSGEHVPDDVQLCPACHVLHQYRRAGGIR